MYTLNVYQFIHTFCPVYRLCTNSFWSRKPVYQLPFRIYELSFYLNKFEVDSIKDLGFKQTEVQRGFESSELQTVSHAPQQGIYISSDASRLNSIDVYATA